MGSERRREPDIYIVGLGIKGIEHLTRETLAACRRSNSVLAVANHPAVLTYLETLCPKVIDLHPLSYEEDGNRLDAYDTMSAMVFQAALENPPVTFATYGHPLIYVYPTRQIIDAAPFLGLTVKVLPAISSLDTMLIDLDVDPAMNGLQMYEATDLLVKQRPLQSDVPCLIWQIGAVESVLYSSAPSKPERFFKILDYLLQFYPPEHEVTAVYSTNHPLLEPSLVRFPLGEMDHHNDDLHQGLTLYLPPVELRSVRNRELAGMIESLDHLKSLTERAAAEANDRT
ncbi:MAG TPA: SAM-dependent methyltransferase [Actinomycetota bacterium]|nr:SAM-dependent methyltransferase [Actinomycetota bacterium]